jgi:signal transduction histidine kinase
LEIPENGDHRSEPIRADQIEIAQALPESGNAEARGYRAEGDSALEADDLDKAATAYQAAIGADDDNIRAHHNLGVVYYRLDEWASARKCFERCKELAPEEADLSFKVGLCYLKDERSDDAQKAFETTLEQNQDHLSARFQLALLYARTTSGARDRGRAVQALQDILSAADKGVPCPNLDRVCFLLGSFLDDHPENRPEAISIYRKGLEVNPLFAQGHNNLGVLLMEEGQNLQALGAFKIALHLEPDYTLPYRNLAHLLFDHMSPVQMEHEYNNIIEEFGGQAANVLARLSLELIDLGRGQVSESLYTRGHQIKNLMGMVGSRMRRLIKKSSEEGLDELKGIAKEQERIFDQWVAYLRSMKQDPMNPTLVDISQLVRKITEVLSGRSGTKALTFASEPNVPHVKIDPGMIREAVTNLILNSVEALPETGRISVQTGYDADRSSVFIEVEDNGPGIQREAQSKIFDPGYSTKEKGNGYGLSICDRIVSAHRGNLRVISQPGAGAVFRIDLPIDFELSSEEDSIGLQGLTLQNPSQPMAEEFIE